MGDEEERELDTQDTDQDQGEDQDTDQDQDTADTDKALSDSDDQEGPPKDVPYARFKEVNDKYTAAADAQTKLDQFKRLGPEGYYQLYPDEKPEDWKPPGKTEDDPKKDDFRKLKVEGGQYDGWTFEDVFKHNERAAFQLDSYYAQILREEKVDGERKATSERERLEKESEEEIHTFTTNLSTELFGKSDGLDDKQKGQINSMVDNIITWMSQTGRGGGNIADAYILMTIDDKLKDKADRTLKTIATVLRDDTPSSISSNKTSPKDGGYMRFLNMTPAQAASEMENWTDAENLEFLQKAPKAIRDKFPSLPWK